MSSSCLRRRSSTLAGCCRYRPAGAEACHGTPEDSLGNDRCEGEARVLVHTRNRSLLGARRAPCIPQGSAWPRRSCACWLLSGYHFPSLFRHRGSCVVDSGHMLGVARRTGSSDLAIAFATSAGIPTLTFKSRQRWHAAVACTRFCLLAETRCSVLLSWARCCGASVPSSREE